MTIKLSELKAARAAMTGGEWRYDHQGWVESMDRGINHSGSETEVLTLGARNDPGDGIGIVATHNAADTLIEIAEAALEWQFSTQTKSRAARKRLLAALAKVSP